MMLTARRVDADLPDPERHNEHVTVRPVLSRTRAAMMTAAQRTAAERRHGSVTTCSGYTRASKSSAVTAAL